MRYGLNKQVYVKCLDLYGIIVGYTGENNRFYCVDIDGRIYYFLHEELSKK
jgi:hypothetical protein